MSQEQEPVTCNSTESASPRDTIDEARIAAHLRRHPDFLQRYPDLVRFLTPPAHRNDGNVEDFRSFLIERLRAEADRLQSENRDLVITSRDNLAGQRRVHDAILALISAPDFEQLINIVTTDLAVILDLDVVTLGVEVAETKWPRVVASGVFTLQPGAIDELVGPARDYVLFRKRPGERAVFGSATGLVQSSALLRLRFGAKGPTGVLALGSRDDDMFHPGQGMELLSFLARVVELCVRAWLDLPE